MSCTDGVCQVPPSACLKGYAHCSTDAADGCETDITTADRCGACDEACGAEARFCALGKCTATCPVAAPEECGSECADLATDPKHCGDCSTACASPVGGTATCSGGKCGVACPNGYHSCGDSECAADTDAEKCGASCQQCPTTANGSTQCVDNACTVACEATYHQCPDNSCASDSAAAKCTKDCIQCSTPNGTSSCLANVCVTTSCRPGFVLCKDGKCVDPSLDPSCGGPPLATGSAHACVIKTNGTVWCWMADAISTPSQISGLTSVIQLSLGGKDCALKSDGTVWCWSLFAPITPPTDVSGTYTFLQIAAGDQAMCGVATGTKRVYCMDYANGTWTQVGAGNTLTATHISFSGSGFARAEDGSYWRWMLGSSPSKQSSPTGIFAQIEAAQESIVWRTSAGGVLYSQNDAAAVAVAGFTGVTFKQVTAGLGGGCALASDDRIGCWGNGAYGQLGNSDWKNSDSMVQFGPSGWKWAAVSRGPLQTCALKTDGSVWCAGNEDCCEDGVPRQVNITVP